MTPSDWLTAAFGMLGVLVGAGITFFMERHFRRQEREQQRIERLNRVQHTTFLLFNSSSAIVGASLDEIPADYKGDLWSVLRPLYGLEIAPIQYDADDMSALEEKDSSEVALELAEIAHLRNSIVHTIPAYNDQRAQLCDMLTPYVTGDGGDRWMLDDGYRKKQAILGREQDVESLAKSLVSGMRRLDDKMRRLVPRYNKLLAELHGGGRQPGLVLRERPASATDHQ